MCVYTNVLKAWGVGEASEGKLGLGVRREAWGEASRDLNFLIYTLSIHIYYIKKRKIINQ